MSHGESLGDGLRRIGQNLRETGENIRHGTHQVGSNQTAYGSGYDSTYNSGYPAGGASQTAYDSGYPAGGANYTAGTYQQQPAMASAGMHERYPEGLSHQHNGRYAWDHPGESLMHGLKQCGQNLKETAQNIAHGTERATERVQHGTQGYAQSAVNPNVTYTAPNPNVPYSTGPRY